MKHLVATALTAGLLAVTAITAAEAKRDDHERNAWNQTMQNETAMPNVVAPAHPALVEGRNATLVVTPYADPQAAANGDAAIRQAEQQYR
ncbi:hypothetical protein MWN34_14170 [Ancylobacter sp. 6x-1]|uniref:DUF4148 domain-containing protein n=1 Tax=Ancylobacter crimeensis TaxID=2579147 RepID=A0ABT0DDM5_9HYPH|nr:hypothetical protein [Ancylobacter crimeensis]MCK0198057.1 hypothetical protein [Ancylobacter crimeensis]